MSDEVGRILAEMEMGYKLEDGDYPDLIDRTECRASLTIQQNTWVHWRCTVCGAAGWDIETRYACDILDALRRAHTHPDGIRVGERRVLPLGERP